MNKQEAHGILLVELEGLRAKPYRELCALMGSPVVLERNAPSGTDYQIEIDVVWDDPKRPQGDIRVIASIDDGGLWSAFVPLTESFIMTPAGGFVGE